MKNGLFTIKTGLYSEDALLFLRECSLSSKKMLHGRWFFCMRDITGEVLICVFEDVDECLDDSQWNKIRKDVTAVTAELMQDFVTLFHCESSLWNCFKFFLLKVFKKDFGVICHSIGCTFDEDIAWLIDDAGVCANSVLLMRAGVRRSSYFKSIYSRRSDLIWLIDYIKNGFKSDIENERMTGKPLDFFEQSLLQSVRSSFSKISKELYDIIYFRNGRISINDDDLKSFKEVIDHIKNAFQLDDVDNEFVKKLNRHLDGFYAMVNEEVNSSY